MYVYILNYITCNVLITITNTSFKNIAFLLKYSVSNSLICNKI